MFQAIARYAVYYNEDDISEHDAETEVLNMLTDPSSRTPVVIAEDGEWEPADEVDVEDGEFAVVAHAALEYDEGEVSRDNAPENVREMLLNRSIEPDVDIISAS